jgi:hypothetical protein
LLPAIIQFQRRRAIEALRAWRGQAARATLSGQLAGFVQLPGTVAARSQVQRGRRINDQQLLNLLAP